MKTIIPRRYLVIWNQIKSKGTCSISAAKNMHPRIIKAVIKEKDMDLGFKFELSEIKSRAKLCITREGVVITFSLKRIHNWDDI